MLAGMLLMALAFWAVSRVRGRALERSVRCLIRRARAHWRATAMNGDDLPFFRRRVWRTTLVTACIAEVLRCWPWRRHARVVGRATGEGSRDEARHRASRSIGWRAAGTRRLATLLVLNAFDRNLVFFFSPSQVAANEAPRNGASASAGWWRAARSA